MNDQILDSIDELESSMMRHDVPQECFDKLEHVRHLIQRAMAFHVHIDIDWEDEDMET